jgi:hypothetical protein
LSQTPYKRSDLSQHVQTHCFARLLVRFDTLNLTVSILASQHDHPMRYIPTGVEGDIKVNVIWTSTFRPSEKLSVKPTPQRYGLRVSKVLIHKYQRKCGLALIILCKLVVLLFID